MSMDEKSAILEIISLTEDVDFSVKENIDDTLGKALKKDILKNTRFGRRLISRLGSLSKDNCEDDVCVLCGKPASSKVVCRVCVSNLRESASEYMQETYGDENALIVADDENENTLAKGTGDYSAPNIDGRENVDATSNSSLEKSEKRSGKRIYKNDELADFSNEIVAKLQAETKASDQYTEDLIRNLDASMDRLASKKAVKSSNRMLMAILVISLLNTISIVSIAIIVFNQLGLL